MRIRLDGVLAMIAAPLIVAATLQPEQSLAVVVLSITAVALARCVAMRMPAPPSAIGARAAQHRHMLDSVPAPTHPRTPGRRRTRAPSTPMAVAHPIR